MSQVAATVAVRERIADFVELTKPGITTMVVVTAAVGYWMGLNGALDPGVLFHVLAGTALSSAGACALNMLIERHGDAGMRRTRSRPIPAGRIRPVEALVFGLVLTLAGVVWLWLGVGRLAGAIAALVAVGYLFAYTPLKPLSSFSTFVGAQMGAAPPLIGWVAARGELGLGAWTLFAIIVCWQWPHILSMAWMNRQDFIEARYPLAPVFDSDGRRASLQMIAACTVLLLAGLLPWAAGIARPAYLVPAVALGLAFGALGVAFARQRTVRQARRVFFASLLYLPLLFLFLVLGKS